MCICSNTFFTGDSVPRQPPGLRHGEQTSPSTPGPTARGANLPVNPWAYGMKVRRAYGTGVNPRKPPGLRHEGSQGLRRVRTSIF